MEGQAKAEKRATRDDRNGSRKPVRGKGKRTRANLMKAAEKVFERDGYLNARVADITKQAGVAHGSFYTYFSSKEDIFRSLADDVVEDVYKALSVRAEGDTPRARIRAANMRYIELYETHASILALIEQVATFDDHFLSMRLDLRRRFIQRIERAVERIMAAADDEVSSKLDVKTMANALGGMTDNFCYTWFVLKESFDREAALFTLNEIWARALGLPEE